jgi:hypothetical protein
VRESVYEGVFDTPKTEAGCRRMPLSAGAVERVGSELALVFDRRESSVPCRIKEKAVTVLFGAPKTFSKSIVRRTLPSRGPHQSLAAPVPEQGRGFSVLYFSPTQRFDESRLLAD